MKTYQRGGPNITWINPKARGTIYLFVIDNSIEDATLDKFKLYCEAFYHGLTIKMVKPGDKIQEK